MIAVGKRIVANLSIGISRNRFITNSRQYRKVPWLVEKRRRRRTPERRRKSESAAEELRKPWRASAPVISSIVLCTQFKHFPTNSPPRRHLNNFVNFPLQRENNNKL